MTNLLQMTSLQELENGFIVFPDEFAWGQRATLLAYAPVMGVKVVKFVILGDNFDKTAIFDAIMTSFSQDDVILRI